MSFLRLISVLLLLPFIYSALSALIKRRIRATFTALDELSGLAVPRKDGKKLRGTAVICGGSIAGLLSARICSDHFENVVIIEPEEWITTVEGHYDRHRETCPPVQKRSRVPQYTSLHGVQPFTILALRKLFQNFDAEVKSAGARFMPVDLNAHVAGVPLSAPLHKYPQGMLPDTMLLTRPGYETTLRRLIATTCSNVRYVPGRVTALVPQESSAHVIASVRVRSRAEEQITIPATLVIDCTGPALGGLQWLQDYPLMTDTQNNVLNTTPPPPFRSLKKTYNPKMSYTTCEFDVPPRLFGTLKAIGFPDDYETAGFQYVCFPDPRQDSRNLIITRRENNFLQIACGGWDVYERMSSIADITSFLSKMVLEHPIPSWIQAMLELFKEEQVPASYVYARCPPSVYVRYHRAEKLPSNFIAIGDSVMQLNPIRGHGCTKACAEAVTLNTMLFRTSPVPSVADGPQQILPDDFGRTFFTIQAKRTGYLWDSYKAEDYAWKSTIPEEGDSLPSFGKWTRAYGLEFIRLALRDREVAAVWWHVTNWLAPPTDVFSPVIVMKMVWMRLRNGLGI